MKGTFDTISRSEKQKSAIRSLWSPPIVVDDFLSSEELEVLRRKISGKESSDSHQGGKKESLVVAKMAGAELPLFFVRKMRKLVRDFRIRGLFAFDSNTPFMIHADSGLDPSKIPYKNFTFCLEDNIFDEQLVLYNAHSYFSVSINDLTKFVYSKAVLDDYKFLLATPDEFVASPNGEMATNAKPLLNKSEKEELLRHIPDVEKEKFDVVGLIPFVKNRLIVFDSCQLHSGSAKVPVQRSAMKRLIIFTEHTGDHGEK